MGRNTKKTKPCRDTKKCVATPNCVTHVATPNCVTHVTTPKSVSRHQNGSPCSLRVATPTMGHNAMNANLSRHQKVCCDTNTAKPGRDTKKYVVTSFLFGPGRVRLAPMSWAVRSCPCHDTTCYDSTWCWKWA